MEMTQVFNALKLDVLEYEIKNLSYGILWVYLEMAHLVSSYYFIIHAYLAKVTKKIKVIKLFANFTYKIFTV